MRVEVELKNGINEAYPFVSRLVEDGFGYWLFNDCGEVQTFSKNELLTIRMCEDKRCKFGHHDCRYCNWELENRKKCLICKKGAKYEI